MFKCLIDGKSFSILEWYFGGVGDSYVKLVDTTYSEVESTFADKKIITNIKITDDSQPDYLEDFNVYLTRKQITVTTEALSQVNSSENTQNVTQVEKETITVILVTPTSDQQVDDIASFVGYVANPDSLSLPEYKNYTINKSKTDLANYLLQHPLESNVHGGTNKNYAITENKQILLLMELMCAQQAAESEIPYQPSWNASGEACTYDWTIDELKTLAFQINQVVKPLISYQQSVEEQIINSESKDTIKAITIDFDANDPRNAQSVETEGELTK